ncbi:MAG TPA: IS110 family transposase [Vicinamibacterales bacterium]|nr:IS110 family transposase [Vicinamibacterales bacterium]
MVYGAIDLHMRYSQIRVVDDRGAVLRDQRILTSRERLIKAFEGFGSMRILLETGTESEWVAQALEQAGHEVVVADPNYAPMYGERQRKVKTDRRDVAALAEANRRGWYRATHRVSAAQRATRQLLRTRRQLVQMRSGAVALIRSLIKQDGYRLPSCGAERVPAKLAPLTLPAWLTAAVTPLARTIEAATWEIAGLDHALRARAKADPIVARLQTVPGVGLIVALTFRTQLDTIDRFTHAGQVSALIGLVPREDSSADRRHRGHITKAGPRELRSLLVQAAWACWRSKQSASLRAWAEQLAARRGRRIAVVALARRLSRILYAIWRDGSTFEGSKLAAAA